MYKEKIQVIRLIFLRCYLFERERERERAGISTSRGSGRGEGRSGLLSEQRAHAGLEPTTRITT